MVKRRTRAGGEATEGRRRKTPKPVRRNAPKTRPNASHSEKETEVVRLARELNEALERQFATSEVLNVISSSSGELDPVFNAILQNAARICQAQFGTLNLYDGTAYRTVALHNAPQNLRGRGSARPFVLIQIVGLHTSHATSKSFKSTTFGHVNLTYKATKPSLNLRI